MKIYTINELDNNPSLVIQNAVGRPSQDFWFIIGYDPKSTMNVVFNINPFTGNLGQAVMFVAEEHVESLYRDVLLEANNWKSVKSELRKNDFIQETTPAALAVK